MRKAQTVPLTLVIVLGGLLPAACQADYDRRSAIVEAIAKTRDSIVNLRTLSMRTIPARFDTPNGEGRVRGLGTGVIVDPRGYVVTNYHVVKDVDEITVATSDDREYRADVIGHQSRADLAVLKLRVAGRASFSYLPLWDPGKPILGETVIAIGNPYGLSNSVTTGIISAIGRELRLPNGEVFQNLIQTDAAINPGNSGGPLLTINGDLLGINVAIRSNAQGIGFVIPTPQVREIVDRIMDDNESSPNDYGLSFADYDYHLTDRMDTDKSAQPTVQIVTVEPKSPAWQVGFRNNDRLLSVDGQEVRLRFDVRRIFWDRKLGDSIRFRVERDGKERELALKLVPAARPDALALWRYLGIEVRKVGPDVVRPVFDKLNGGLLVLKVAPDSAAAQADWRVGDILIGLHDYETVNLSDVRYVMQWRELPQYQPIKFHLIRDGRLQPEGRLHLPAEPRAGE